MEFVKGSDLQLQGTVYTKWTGDISTSILATPVQMTGATCELYVKQRSTDSDANAVVVINGSVTDTVNALINFVIAASVTNSLSLQTLVCEAVTKLSDGTYQRSGLQPFTILPNVGDTLF